MEPGMMKRSMTYRGDCLEQEPMSRHTSWRVGGAAEYFYRPADIDDLSNYLSALDDDAKLTWVGLGSNLLVRDGGLDGTVICTSGVLGKIELLSNNRIYIEVGVASPKVARFSARQGLAGAEFLCGIPGTFGGALAMNAGAVGGETWDIVKSVETIDIHGQRHTRTPDEFDIKYRHVSGINHEWFVSAVIQLEPGNKDESMNKIKQHLARRSATQPTQQPNAGSVFRNPEGDYAARLIEECGMKNNCVGGACVSEKHANFIINTGRASASDIENLIQKVQQKVKEVFNVELIPEVQVVGNKVTEV